MATSAKVHVHDTGFVFIITVQDELGVVDITSVQSLTLYFKKPDQSVVSRPCSIVNGSAGLARYVSLYEDFDQAGRWEFQFIVYFTDDNIKHSDVGSFNVASNITKI